MKYTTKVKQAQMVGDVKIDPKGGDLSSEQVKKIEKDPYGKDLLEKGYLTIEGYPFKKEEAKPANPESPAAAENK